MLFPTMKPMYALSSRDVEYTFVVVDDQTKKPIPNAELTFYSEGGSQKLESITTDNQGIAVFTKKDQFVEDVIGISASTRLVGVKKHPEGTGTLINRFWCVFGITAEKYRSIEYESLGDHEYEDAGYDKTTQCHRCRFTIGMIAKEYHHHAK
jgi:hypothetical protein